MATKLTCRRARGDDGVQEPGAIAVAAQAMIAGEVANGRDLLELPATAAAEIRGLLDGHHAAYRRVSHLWPQRVCDLVACEDSALSLEWAQQGAGDHRRSRGF